MNIECRVLCVSFIPEEFRVLVKKAVEDIGLVRKVLSMVGTIDTVDSSILYSLYLRTPHIRNIWWSIYCKY